MTDAAHILVATDTVADGALVRKLLSQEDFGHVVVSADEQKAVQDFEHCKPAVLVLAFDALEKAERYYLGLYRLSERVQALPHRTVILCNKDEVRRVYELCKREYFDDYVLFWPMTNDAVRLPMAVHHALRQGAAAQGPSVREMAVQARRIAALESLLHQYAAQGGQRVEAASRSLQQAGQNIGAALDGFSRRMSDGELGSVVDVKDRDGLQREFERLKTDEIDRNFKAVTALVQPVRRWVDALPEQVAPQLESARALQALVERVHPLVLVVDDDEFHNKVLKHALAGENLDLVFAASGVEALAMVRRCRPDLVFMDIDLPGIDGFEATRRLKSTGEFTATPVVMITGHGEKEVVVKCLGAGAVDFIVKPFDRATLLAKLRKLLKPAAAA